MNADDLIKSFNELAKIDSETRIEWSRSGDETVTLVPSYKKNAVRQFNALAVDATALFNLPGPRDPVTRWLCFVRDNAKELAEDCEQGPFRSIGYLIELLEDGTEKRIQFTPKKIPNAVNASALVVRRCRNLVEPEQQRLNHLESSPATSEGKQMTKESQSTEVDLKLHTTDKWRIESLADQEEEQLSITRAAGLIKMSESKIYRMLSDGLPCSPPMGDGKKLHRRIWKSDLLAWFNGTHPGLKT